MSLLGPAEIEVALPFLPGEYRIEQAREAWQVAGCMSLRRQVFCAEQKIFETDDRDAVDYACILLAASACMFGHEDAVVGTVRIHAPEPGLWWGSRLAVAKPFRRVGGLGAALIRLAVGTAKAQGAQSFLAHVQAQNVTLFESLHWRRLDEKTIFGRPHYLMSADLAFYDAMDGLGPAGDPAFARTAMNLGELTAMLREAKGVAHKRDIAPVLARLGQASPTAIPVGDDCAAIPDGDGFLLFAIEGFMPEFVAADPYFAGYCGVMVNVSDIAAMGGRPVAVVDALFAASAEAASPVLEGMAAASARYGVPVVGGHTNMRAAQAGLSVAILGRASKLLTSFDAQPGQVIIAAIDLRAPGCATPALYWDASSGADSARLRADLLLLPEIAEADLCAAAKDISMAGVVGTTLMLLEASRLGGVIEPAAIPRPPGIVLERWLLAFPSFGFLLAVEPQHVDAVVGRFTARGICATAIGSTDASGAVRLRDGAEEQVLWRF